MTTDTKPTYKFGDDFDLLDRKEHGEGLLNLVKNYSKFQDELQNDFVISLNGDWGEGKTVFVKMWQELLNESSIQNIYIDAFANDYVDDAFMVVASAITQHIEKLGLVDKLGKNFKESTKKVALALLPLAVRIASMGILKDTDLESYSNTISQIGAEATKHLIQEKLESLANEQNLIEEFKNSLSKLIEYDQGDNNANPLVIIIDELDRCRPDFALQLLEKIKHIFSVKGVIFVLVMNKAQMECCIKSVYGHDIDAKTYLQKFIHLEVQIPKIVKTDGHIFSDTYKYVSKFVTNTIIRKDYTEFLAGLPLSLRDLDRIFMYYSLLEHKFDENSKGVVFILFFSTIKVIAPELFNKFSLQQKVAYSEITSTLGLTTDLESTCKIMIWMYVALVPSSSTKQRKDIHFTSIYNYLFAGNGSLDKEYIGQYFARLTREMGIIK